MDPYEHFNTYDLLWIINIQWLCTSSRATNVLNNETNINPIKIHCCLWLTFWILNNTHNAPLLSRGLPQVTFDLPGTCWIQIKCRFVLLRLNKLNPSTAVGCLFRDYRCRRLLCTCSAKNIHPKICYINKQASNFISVQYVRSAFKPMYKWMSWGYYRKSKV